MIPLYHYQSYSPVPFSSDITMADTSIKILTILKYNFKMGFIVTAHNSGNETISDPTA